MDHHDPTRQALTRPPHRRRLARCALDAVHRQPRLQGQPAHDGVAPAAATTPTSTAARFSTASPACGPAAWATAAPRSWKRRRHQLATLDYSPAFQFGHPLSFALANKLKELTPAGLDYVFFTGSGSESADTSLKMARAYWRAKGQASKTPLIGREKGYHGVNFGGISVGGIGGNRKMFGQGIEADHLPHTQPPAGAFIRGMADTGAALADELLKLIALHDASNIAAVIVEPMSGSAGVVVPPKGYLQRLREICTANNILLIFDEVITGFGRLGAYTGAEVLWRHARHHELRQADHQRRAAAGRGDRQKGDLRHLHGRRRPRLHARVCPRLHLLGAPGGVRGGHWPRWTSW